MNRAELTSEACAKSRCRYPITFTSVMRALIEAAQRRSSQMAVHNQAHFAGRLHGLVAEVTKLPERVDSALQVAASVHFVRVYVAAMRSARVPAVRAAVDRKLAIVRHTYTVLHGEAAGARAELLEAAILALIAGEIFLSLVRH